LKGKDSPLKSKIVKAFDDRFTNPCYETKKTLKKRQDQWLGYQEEHQYSHIDVFGFTI